VPEIDGDGALPPVANAELVVIRVRDSTAARPAVLSKRTTAYECFLKIMGSTSSICLRELADPALSCGSKGERFACSKIARKAISRYLQLVTKSHVRLQRSYQTAEGRTRARWQTRRGREMSLYPASDCKVTFTSQLKPESSRPSAATRRQALAKEPLVDHLWQPVLGQRVAPAQAFPDHEDNPADDRLSPIRCPRALREIRFYAARLPMRQPDQIIQGGVLLRHP
jgi:hypothetical protein